MFAQVIRHTDQQRESTIKPTAIARGGTFALLGLVGGALLQYAANIWFARLYGAGATGLFAFSFNIVSVIAILGQLGFQETLLRYVAAYRGAHEGKLLRSVLIFSLAFGSAGSILFALLTFTSTDTISRWSDKADVRMILSLLSWTIPFWALISLLGSALQGNKQMAKAAFSREIGRPLALIIALGVAWFLKLPISGLLTYYIASLFLLSLISLFIVKQSFLELSQHSGSLFFRWEWVSFAFPVMLLDVFRSTTGRIDTLLLGFLGSSEETGIYFAASRTALIITMMLAAFNAILSPIAADLWHKQDKAELDRTFKVITRWTCLVTLPVTITALITRHEIMAMYGEKFEAGGIVLLIMLIGATINAVTGGVGRLLMMTGHQKLELYNSIGAVMIQTVGTALLVPSLGMVGAAIVDAGVLIGMNVLKLFQVKHFIGIQPYERSYIKLIIATLLAYSLGYWVYSYFADFPQLFVIALTLIVVMVIYLLTLLLFGIEKEERALLAQGKANFLRKFHITKG